MNFENKFQKDKAFGKKGENFVAEYYHKLGYEINDVSEDKQYQEQDIDFIIDGISVEVKTQNCLQEQKICVEIISNLELQREGWLKKTAAQYIIFVDTVNKIMYKIFTEKLREYYYTNISRINKITQRNHDKTSIICFIPLDELANFTERMNLNDFMGKQE